MEYSDVDKKPIDGKKLTTTASVRIGAWFRASRYLKALGRNIVKYKYLYILLIPCLAYYVIFWGIPMIGIQIAFKELNPVLGISKSPWVGLKYFKDFFSYYQIGRLFYNTIGISLLKILFGFSAPVFLALMINEIKFSPLKRVVQTISYLPHFISWVIISTIIYRLFALDGIVNDVLAVTLGLERQVFMVEPKLFWPLIVISDIWKEVGFASIIYLAAIAGIDAEQYEAAKVDGAGRLRQMWNVTLPGITPTIIILFVLRVGSIMQAGFDQIWTLRNYAVSEVTDVLEVYVMISGIQKGQFGYAAAVGLFTGLIGFLFMIIANSLANRYSDTSLW